ncbi:AAA family ATPase [Gordonia sp. (in: high G+C Gram-positive bacteria)]|jgi:hypothetical protein|uniref:AAA family ATPase n=1 Tax=Gordonia sp. (in: high G+C Gram-positive bacteria) TaxID=84139 RepID=UPI001D572E52|nr:AAA family ATPase [Gordonia sp. (in: high G+C Gram-positive bacteria)]MCB1296759.1 ATP-binding protein [Gordonia sp. (in: high G+C Gram-positive bacteria)]HMS74681.1 AAA family ATPase [Gordonia sp. (in: high G+C Gram-positive bacteria)]
MTDIDISGEQFPVRRSIELIARLLGGAVSAADEESTDSFLLTHLGARRSSLVGQRIELSSATFVAGGLVMADLMAEHEVIVGPGSYDSAPSWTSHRLGSDDISVPSCLTAFFPDGLLVGNDPVAVQISAEDRGYLGSDDGLTILAGPGSRELATETAALIRDRIRLRNPLRGKMLSAISSSGSVVFDIVDPQPAGRGDVIVDSRVWHEIDLSIRSVTDRRDILLAAGFSTSRGLMLAGPPGVGKTAVARVIAHELVAQGFTVMLVDPDVGSRCLSSLYAHAAELSPSVVVLDDVDLYTGRRGGHTDDGLGAFLSALDGARRHNDVLSVATTNDPKAMDAAAIRASRFDSIIEMGLPSDQAAERILTRSLSALDHSVDVHQVVRAFPPERSGADICEAVRRAILTVDDGVRIGTADLIGVISAGSYRAELPTGAYL